MKDRSHASPLQSGEAYIVVASLKSSLANFWRFLFFRSFVVSAFGIQIGKAIDRTIGKLLSNKLRCFVVSGSCARISQSVVGSFIFCVFELHGEVVRLCLQNI